MVSFDPYTAQQQEQAVEMNTFTRTQTALTASETAFELEKSHITSYEEGWDRWDGPVWPLGTLQCSLQNPNCTLSPCPQHHPAKPTAAETAFELERSQITSYEEGWDTWDGPIWPLGTVQCSLQNPNCVLKPCPEHHPAKPTADEAAFETEKAKVVSYEEGWDRWDGPVWPLGTMQCDLQNPNCVLKPCPEHCPMRIGGSSEQ